MGECNDWMEENKLPDDFFDLPNEDLCDAVVQYAKSDCPTAPMLTDGLVTVNPHNIELCDAQSCAIPIDNSDGLALTSSGSADNDDAVDSCDELARDLAVPNDDAKQSSEEFTLRLRREQEPAGFLFYPGGSGKVPILTAHVPKQKISTDEVAEALKEKYRQKHGSDEPANFQTAMLQVAGVYRELVDDGKLAQKDRLSRIQPVLTETYKKLFRRKAASFSNDLKKDITRIVINTKCKHCGKTFCASDPLQYGSDADGNAVVVGKKTYNTRDFCEQRCEQRSLMFKCKCGKQLNLHKVFGLLKAKCPDCGPNTQCAGSLRDMDSQSVRHEVKRFYRP
jgi:hypothetical protein